MEEGFRINLKTFLSLTNTTKLLYSEVGFGVIFLGRKCQTFMILTIQYRGRRSKF